MRLKLSGDALIDTRTGRTFGGTQPHVHPLTEVTGLLTALGTKADVGHTHGAHEHVIADVLTLQALLDGKAATSHAHAEYEPADAALQAHLGTAHAPANAEANVNADWNALSGDALILNKPTLGGAAALNVGTTAGTVAAGDHAHPGGSGPTTLRKTADQASTSATLWASVTDLAYPVSAGTAYHFDFCVYYTAAATATALHLAIDGPVGATLRMNVDTQTSATAHHHATQTIYNTVTNPATSGGATALMARVTGTLVVGILGGTLALRMKSEVAGSTVTVLANSWGVIY